MGFVTFDPASHLVQVPYAMLQPALGVRQVRVRPINQRRDGVMLTFLADPANDALPTLGTFSTWFACMRGAGEHPDVGCRDPEGLALLPSQLDIPLSPPPKAPFWLQHSSSRAGDALDTSQALRLSACSPRRNPGVRCRVSVVVVCPLNRERVLQAQIHQEHRTGYGMSDSKDTTARRYSRLGLTRAHREH
eukprot:1500160-Rhodomonas_salina.2